MQGWKAFRLLSLFGSIIDQVYVGLIYTMNRFMARPVFFEQDIERDITYSEHETRSLIIKTLN